MAPHELRLSRTVSSCSMARRFVIDQLDGLPPQMRDTAELLTSEVVTNALFHAAGPLTVTVDRSGDRCRVEVADTGTIPPAPKEYGIGATTGRGLQLLTSLAYAWGWQPTPSGKVVWFEVDGDGSSASGTTPMARTSGHEPYPSGTDIALLHAPVQAMIRAGAHYDALYRECRFIVEREPSVWQAPAGRLLHLLDGLGTQFLGFGPQAEESWQAAMNEGRSYFDLSFRLPAEAAPVVERFGQLLDAVDDDCRSGRLRAPVAPSETRAVRQWAFNEIARQCRGGLPRGWHDRIE